jgi:hypothetical protein
MLIAGILRGAGTPASRRSVAREPLATALDFPGEMAAPQVTEQGAAVAEGRLTDAVVDFANIAFRADSAAVQLRLWDRPDAKFPLAMRFYVVLL